MHDRRLIAFGAAAVLVAVATVAIVLFSPRWAVGHLDGLAKASLGRSVTAAGGAHLQFSPLAIRLDDAALSGPAEADDSFATAGTVEIPVTFGQLLSRQPSLAAITLHDAEFAFLINERGEANWDFPGLTAFTPGRLVVDKAKIRYFDARNNQSLSLANVDGVAELTPAGGFTFDGNAVINGRVVRINADLKSLARVDADGSPFELALATSDGTADFSGRLSTGKVLSLAGPVSLASSAPLPALQLLGLPLPEGLNLPGSITIDGTLDTAGRAYAVRNATLTLGEFRAAGDVVADLRGERPKLQASLAADTVWLDPFMPAAGAKDGDWGRAPLPFALLKTFDAELGIDARRLAYGNFAAGSSRLKLTLADGKLDSSIISNLDQTGTANVSIKADAGQLPPSVALSLDVQDVQAQPLLGTLTGATQVTGTGDFGANLTASGQTQEELIGTLKGSANITLLDGRIAGTDLAGLFLAARQKILEGWAAAPGGTAFKRLAADMTIADGIASVRGATIETDKVLFTVEGLADVLRKGLEVSTTATASGQPLLPVPVIARGPWAAPKIYPDIPNILTNPEGGFARLQEPDSTQGN